jgi:hypothetical protein
MIQDPLRQSFWIHNNILTNHCKIWKTNFSNICIRRKVFPAFETANEENGFVYMFLLYEKSPIQPDRKTKNNYSSAASRIPCVRMLGLNQGLLQWVHWQSGALIINLDLMDENVENTSPLLFPSFHQNLRKSPGVPIHYHTQAFYTLIESQSGDVFWPSTVPVQLKRSMRNQLRNGTFTWVLILRSV